MKQLRVFLVDDEPLAIKRLARLLLETKRVEIVGQTSEPLKALEMIPKLKIDTIFLDIQMPELTGFELLQKLKNYPPIIFTTAFDEFALKAFEVYSVDYLLKPIESERLELALEKLQKLVSANEATANIEKLLENLPQNKNESIKKIASRVGTKVQVLDVSEITHFFSQDKVTFAQMYKGKTFPIDDSLNKLEKKLDPQKFIRVHRNAIVNFHFIDEVHGWFSGRVMIRLKDKEKAEIVVARARVKGLRELLGM